jgi:hypothetical protein
MAEEAKSTDSMKVEPADTIVTKQPVTEEAKSKDSMKVEPAETAASTEDVMENLRQSEEEEAKRKLYVYNTGQRTRKEQLGAFLTKMELEHLKIMKPPSQNYAIVTFKDADAAAKAKTALDGKSFEGNKLDVQPVKPRKRKRQGEDGGPNAKRSDKFDEKDLSNYLKVLLGSEYPRSVKDITTPLWEMPYEEQLKRKQDEMRKVMFKLWRRTRNEYWKKAKRDNHKLTKSSYFKMVTNNFEKTKMPSWLMRISPGGGDGPIGEGDDSHPSSGKTDSGKLLRLADHHTDTPVDADLYCPLDQILSVPSARDGYRNKCEFTIGLDSSSKVMRAPLLAFRSLSHNPCPHPAVRRLPDGQFQGGLGCGCGRDGK